MADIDAALDQQIFDLSQRQRVADIHHHREPDDLWRTVEIAEGVLHLVKLWMPHLHINPFLSDNTVLAKEEGRFLGAIELRHSIKNEGT